MYPMANAHLIEDLQQAAMPLEPVKGPLGPILSPDARRKTILKIIQSARASLILSIFQCDDLGILEALAAAVRRHVNVKILVSRRARGWKKRLEELSGLLEMIGAEVYRYSDAVKYHAKYIVADEDTALVGSFNLTRKCFSNTCDFLLITHDSTVISGLKTLFETDVHMPAARLPDITDQLIVGPDQTRSRLMEIFSGARESIRIIDRRVTDPEVRWLLHKQKQSGITVQILDEPFVGDLASHGTMFLVDSRIAITGSVALSTMSLDVRRELDIVTTDTTIVSRLNDFFETVMRHKP